MLNLGAIWATNQTCQVHQRHPKGVPKELDLVAKSKHKLKLRNWGLRSREGLRGSKHIKKFEPLKKNVDFLSLSGGVMDVS